MFGPDSVSSLSINEIKTLTEGIRYIEIARKSSVNRILENDIIKMRDIFEKSLSVNKHLKKGHIISFGDLESKKPSGMGISPSQFEDIIGEKLNKNKNKYDFLNYEDLK